MSIYFKGARILEFVAKAGNARKLHVEFAR